MNKKWAIITGAGSGIGQALSKKLIEKNYNVLGVGRRLDALELTEEIVYKSFRNNKKVGNDQKKPIFKKLAVDITNKQDQLKIYNSIPKNDILSFLVHNAAVGDPSNINEIDVEHFRYTLDVNVVAPLSLSQMFFTKLSNNKNINGGRILHLGTGVAHQIQRGTGTYGISKLAFYRLYQQLNIDYEDTNVYITSARPGVVATEGMIEHVNKANELKLPHAEYFNKLFENKNSSIESQQMQAIDVVAEFLYCLLTKCPKEEYGRKEWSVNEGTNWWMGSNKAHL